MRTIHSLRDHEGTPHTLTYDFLDARQHRKIIFYDDIPHIIQYGCHSIFNSHEGERSEVGLWRQGKKFCITLDAQDIPNTRLYDKCRPLWHLRFKDDKLDKDGRVAYKTHWNDCRAQLFDLMINQCLPLLQSLAPVQEHWQTIGDHLHCPTYAYKITADKRTGEIIVEPIEPIQKNTAVYFDYDSKATKWVGGVPAEIPQYSPYDLVPAVSDLQSLGESLFETPRKVHLKDGTPYYFFSGECGGEWDEVFQIRDESQNTIRTYFEITKAAQEGRCEYPRGLLKMIGVVIDHEQLDGSPERDCGTFIAGILLPWMPGMKTLRAYGDAPHKRMLRWRRQISDTITSLHELGIAVGAEDIMYAEDPFSYVKDQFILIESEKNAYLTLTDPVFAVRSFDGQSYAKYAKLDLEALDRVFPGCSEEEKTQSRL